MKERHDQPHDYCGSLPMPHMAVQASLPRWREKVAKRTCCGRVEGV